MAQISVRRGVFFVVVLLTLALAGLFAGMVVLMNVQPGFLGMAHFTELHHRIHDLSFAFLNATTTVGMLAQLRRPVRNVASQLMALVPFAALLLSVVLTNWSVLSPPWLLVGAAAVLATMLHPAGDPLRSFSLPRADRTMLALIGIVAVPLLAFAFTNVGLQRVGAGDHAQLGHYGYMAALSFTVIVVGALASLRPDGWRLVAWVAAALPAALGVASLVYPDVASALSLPWAIVAIAWGVVFVARAEILARHDSATARADA